MKFKSAMVKGTKGEHEVIELLQAVLDRVLGERRAPRLRRCPYEQRAGLSGSDVSGLPQFAIEVKRQEREEQIGLWWTQCVNAARDACPNDHSKVSVVQCNICGGAGRVWVREPVLFWRRNHAKWSVRVMARVGLPLKYADHRDWRVVWAVDINLPMFLEYFERWIRAEYGVGDTQIGKTKGPTLSPAGNLFPPLNPASCAACCDLFHCGSCGCCPTAT